MEELLGSKRVGAVSISNEAEAFGKFFEVSEGHTHCHDTGTNAPVVRDLVAKDRAFGGIHNEPDVGLDATDLDIGLIGGKGGTSAVIVVVHKWFHADGGGFAVVGDLLMRDGDAVEVF